MMLRIRCKAKRLLKTPERFNRYRMYWPHRHFPCVIMSCVGTGVVVGIFQPIVFDNLRETTSLTLLKRRRADIAKMLSVVSDPLDFGIMSATDECRSPVLNVLLRCRSTLSGDNIFRATNRR